VGLSVLFSRLLGLLRETLLAALLGVSTAGDVYRDAFVIPDLINYFLAGGFLSITLIPLLARRIATDDGDGFRADFATVFRVAAWAIAGLTVLMLVVAGPAIRLVFPVLDPAAVSDITRLTRVALPAQIFFVLGSLLMSAQYVHRRFVVPALAPIVYNLAIIAGGLLGAADGSPDPDGFVWGALVGAAVGSFGLQWWGAHRAGLRWSKRRSPVLTEYLSLALPLMVGQSIAVLDEQFPRVFGQVAGEGATAALSFARMLNMLPVGILAQAAAVASFPFLARLVAGGEEDEADRVTLRSIRTTVALSLGAAAAVWAAARPLVRLVYQWGEFDVAASDQVSALLTIFALSIPAWAIHQLVARWFYAHGRMWLPVMIGTSATAVAIPLTLVMAGWLRTAGVALASSSMIWLYTAALTGAWGIGQRHRIGGVLDALVRGLPAALAGAAAGRLLADRLPDQTAGQAAMAGVLTTVVVLATYGGIARLLGLVEVDPRNWRRDRRPVIE
jgi:putative peptidoglycan lipid II flippase